jgi:hypothetical protein
MRAAPVLFLALLFPAAAPAAPPFPGGLLDSTGRSVFLAGQGCIEALDLARGDVLWRTELASQPLLVAGDRLYALARSRGSRLHVRGFDLTDKGTHVFETSAIDLPRWVVPEDGPGHSFTFTHKQDKHTLQLRWSASAGGDGPRKEAAGLVRLDLETGTVAQQALEVSSPSAGPRIPPQLEKLAVRWQRSSGGRLAALVLEDLPGSVPGKRQQRLMLRAWNEQTGQEEPARELLRGARLVVLVGLDDSLWLRDALAGPDEAGKPGRSAGPAWFVFVPDGRLIGRVPFVPGTRATTLLDTRAYCLTVGGARLTGSGTARSTGTLHAIDLASGRTVWHRRLPAPAAPAE